MKYIVIFTMSKDQNMKHSQKNKSSIGASAERIGLHVVR